MNRPLLYNRIDIPAGLQRSCSAPLIARAVGRHFDAKKAADDRFEIDVYDEIGYFGVDANSFRSALRDAQGQDLIVRINSPGGDVFDGITMYNDLQAYEGNVEVQVSGVAASAASVIAMAGDTITMAENSFMMIHNVWGAAVGNRHEMLAMAAVMAKIDHALVITYANRTDMEPKAISRMLDAETWLSASEAVASGFANAISSVEEVSARFDMSAFKNIPEGVPSLDESEEVSPRSFRDYERLLTQDAGMSRSDARSILRKGLEGHDSTMQDAGGSGDGDDVAEFVSGFSPDFLTHLK